MLVRRRFDAEALDPIGHTMSVSRLHCARSLGGLRIEPSGRSLPLEPRRCPSRPRREADEVCCAAAYHGNIAVLEEARRLGYQWDERTPAAAARMGHIHVLKWLRSVPAKERCPWSETTTAAAADGNQLEILRWVRQRKCPWDSRTCLAAAKRGFLPILQWARKNSCPWNEGVAVAALSGPSPTDRDQTGAGGHPDVFFWAVENSLPYYREDCFLEAAVQGLTSVLEHVFGEIKGDDPPGAHPIYEDVVRSAAVHGQLSTLEWCLRHGMLAHELGTAYEMMDGAAAHRQFNVLEWALSKGLVNSEQMSVVLSHVLKERQGHLPVSGAPTGEQP